MKKLARTPRYQIQSDEETVQFDRFVVIDRVRLEFEADNHNDNVISLYTWLRFELATTEGA